MQAFGGPPHGPVRAVDPTLRPPDPPPTPSPPARSASPPAPAPWPDPLPWPLETRLQPGDPGRRESLTEAWWQIANVLGLPPGLPLPADLEALLAWPLAVSPDGRTLAVRVTPAAIALHGLADRPAGPLSGAPAATLSLPGDARVLALAFVRSGSFLVAGGLGPDPAGALRPMLWTFRVADGARQAARRLGSLALSMAAVGGPQSLALATGRGGVEVLTPELEDPSTPLEGSEGTRFVAALGEGGLLVAGTMGGGLKAFTLPDPDRPLWRATTSLDPGGWTSGWMDLCPPEAVRMARRGEDGHLELATRGESRVRRLGPVAPGTAARFVGPGRLALAEPPRGLCRLLDLPPPDLPEPAPPPASRRAPPAAPAPDCRPARFGLPRDLTTKDGRRVPSLSLRSALLLGGRVLGGDRSASTVVAWDPSVSPLGPDGPILPIDRFQMPSGNLRRLEWRGEDLVVDAELGIWRIRPEGRQESHPSSYRGGFRWDGIALQPERDRIVAAAPGALVVLRLPDGAVRSIPADPGAGALAMVGDRIFLSERRRQDSALVLRSGILGGDPRGSRGIHLGWDAEVRIEDPEAWCPHLVTVGDRVLASLETVESGRLRSRLVEVRHRAGVRALELETVAEDGGSRFMVAAEGRVATASEVFGLRDGRFRRLAGFSTGLWQPDGMPYWGDLRGERLVVPGIDGAALVCLESP